MECSNIMTSKLHLGYNDLRLTSLHPISLSRSMIHSSSSFLKTQSQFHPIPLLVITDSSIWCKDVEKTTYREAVVTYELADINWDSLGFVLVPTDYMYMMKCPQNGTFSNGQLQRFGPIQLNPSSGGTDGVKTIENYAPVLKAQSIANGYSDVLYLDAVHKKVFVEGGERSRLELLFWLVVGFVVVVERRVESYPAEDFVPRLQGQPDVGFRQYAGYVTVDEKAGRSLFYYFTEADDDANKKSLTLWLNGVPDCSSVGGGTFTELGPFYPRGDARDLRLNKKSWNKVSNLLFVESPARFGWSYSNTTSNYSRGDQSTANDMHIFLMQWYNKFPEFKSRDIFLSGESYA